MTVETAAVPYAGKYTTYYERGIVIDAGPVDRLGGRLVTLHTGIIGHVLVTKTQDVAYLLPELAAHLAAEAAHLADLAAREPEHPAIPIREHYHQCALRGLLVACGLR